MGYFSCPVLRAPLQFRWVTAFMNRGTKLLEAMRRVLLIALVALCFMPARSMASDAQESARQCFARGEYQAGVRLLKSTAGDSGQADSVRLGAMADLARFYADQVGDHARAIRLYRQALRLSTADAAIDDRLQTELDRLIAAETTHRRLNETLRQFKAVTFQRRLPGEEKRQRSLLCANIRRLNAILEKEPAYHRRHEVHYVLGLTHLALDRPLRAMRRFDAALVLKPAMGLAQPIERLREKARDQWLRTSGRWTAWSVLGVLLVVLALTGMRARPWRWLRLGHLMIGLGVVLAWCALFYGAHRTLADPDVAGRLINNDGVYPSPVYIHLRFGTPGSEVAQALFGYGLVAVSGIVLFAVTLARTRRRWLALTLNLSFAVLFAGCLATLFTLDWCDTHGRLYTGAAIDAVLPAAYLAYPMNDPEPYLLVNPLYYRGLDLSSIDDPVLIEWLSSWIGMPTGEH